MPSVIVSFKPPLLLIITPHPRLAASKLVLPNGSFHLEQTTDIEVFSRFFKTSLWLWKPKIFNLSWLKKIFSLGSSPITIADQFLKSFNMGIIAFPKISYPFAEFSLPTKVIIFFLFFKLIFFGSIDCLIISSLFE